MARKRKRALSTSKENIQKKQCKATTLDNAKASPPEPVHHPTLALYYAQTWTLRQYLLSKLPKTSKNRRRKLATAGLNSLNDLIGLKGIVSCKQSIIGNTTSPQRSSCIGDATYHSSQLADLLERTLVGTNGTSARTSVEYLAKDLDTFTQQVSMTAGSNMTQGLSSHSDLVDFAIWMLFNRIHRRAHRPPHILCHGYQRAQAPNSASEDQCAMAGIPGIVAHYPNNNVNLLKGSDWASVMALLGEDREKAMLDMLLDRGLFVPCSQNNGNYYQLSGKLLLRIFLLFNVSRNSST